MGCPTECEIGETLVFSICTHDPDTGVLTDADGNPAYRIYEEETAVPILTGTMAILDNANTTGFYTESIECSTANGFEDGKNYTVYITATVDGDTGGITFTFKSSIKMSRSYWILNNKMNVTDATGVVALRAIGDGSTIATGSVTDNLTTTVRGELTWA